MICSLDSYERLHTCVHCEEQFTSVLGLHKHILSTHNTGEGPYFCIQCDKQFKSWLHLNLHEHIPESERKYGCTQCDKRFVQVTDLCKHAVDCVHSTRFLADSAVAEANERPSLGYLVDENCNRQLMNDPRKFPTSGDCGEVPYLS